MPNSAAAEAIELSLATVRTIRQSLVCGLIHTMLALPIAAGALYPATGWLRSLMLDSAAMAFTRVSIVTNIPSLRRAS